MKLRTNETLYRILIAGPPLLVVVVLAWGMVRERAAEQRFHLHVAEFASEGIPTSGLAILQAIDQNTSKQHAAAWSEVLNAASIIGEMERDHVKGIEDLVPPSEPWAAEPFALAIHEHAEPVLAKLDELLRVDEKVWQPMLRRAYYFRQSSLWQVDSVAELLINQFRIAVHAGDAEQAIECLSKCREVGRRFDWEAGNSQYWHSRWSQTLERIMRESVAIEFWSDEQLVELTRLIVADRVFQRHLEEASEFETAAFVASRPLDSPEISVGELCPFGLSPFHALAELEWLQSAPKDARYDRIAKLPAKTETAISDEAIIDRHRSWVSVPWATLNNAIQRSFPVTPGWQRVSLFANYDARRWTLTAILLRRFYHAERRFPASLDQLTLVGATPDIWTLASSEPLGYRVGPEGKSAVLWTDAYRSYPGDNGGEGVGVIPYSERAVGPARAESFELWLGESSHQ